MTFPLKRNEYGCIKRSFSNENEVVMEPLEDSNCHSMSDNFSLYERYLRSFNVVDPMIEESVNRVQNERVSSTNCDSESSHSRGNIELAIVTSNNVLNKQCETAETATSLYQIVCERITDKRSCVNTDLCVKIDSPCSPLAASLLENSSATAERSLINDKSYQTDVPLSSEDSRFESVKHPVFITPTMENSNNAVDSVPMFRDLGPSENVFKLPISELTFNGTIKHVQKLKPIVDPISALSSSTGLVSLEEKREVVCAGPFASRSNVDSTSQSNDGELRASDASDSVSDRIDKTSESTGDSQYEDNIKKDCPVVNDDGSTSKWNSEQSYSSLEASFDSGVRSPDMFSDEDEEDSSSEAEPFWGFLKDYEIHDKRKVKKIEVRTELLFNYF